MSQESSKPDHATEENEEEKEEEESSLGPSMCSQEMKERLAG
jgi:hypothetical protein